MYPLIPILAAVLALTGCATTNDSGVRLLPKPDLSGVAPGTPVDQVAALRKPARKQAVTDGRFAGAETWIYEWDSPDDGVNNRMFTSVVVKDGVVLDHNEETPDKWRQSPQLHMTAKVESALEDVASLNANAARQQRAAFLHAHPDPATQANTWELLIERTRSIRRDHAVLSATGQREDSVDEPQSASAAVPERPEETPASASLAPPRTVPPEPGAPAPALPNDSSVIRPGHDAPVEVVVLKKTLRQLEAEELRIREDASLTRKERLRRLHEVWKQQREVMGESALAES